MSDPIPISVCCLLADSNKEPQSWHTGFYWKELTDDTPDEKKALVAQEFIELDVDREGLSIGEFTTDVLVCTIHPDHIECCEDIDFADMAVDEEHEIRRWPIAQTHTVCGMFLETGQCYSGLWVAHGPLLAYSTAWNHLDLGGTTLLVSCVHEGEVPRIPWTPGFADASCITQMSMNIRLAELVTERKNT